MWKAKSHRGKQFLTKLNINLAYNPAIPLLRELAKRNENGCPHEDLCTNVDSSIHNCKKKSGDY